MEVHFQYTTQCSVIFVFNILIEMYFMVAKTAIKLPLGKKNKLELSGLHLVPNVEPYI